MERFWRQRLLALLLAAVLLRVLLRLMSGNTQRDSSVGGTSRLEHRTIDSDYTTR